MIYNNFTYQSDMDNIIQTDKIYTIPISKTTLIIFFLRNTHWIFNKQKDPALKRYILTGTPGCGKTSVIKALADKGYLVVHEAATDVIADQQARGHAEPWVKPSFIDQIVKLQCQRQKLAEKSNSPIQFYDRSPLCTFALALYLGYEPSVALLAEIERTKGIYENKVFFVENLGFCEPTAARKITFDEALKFEKIHEEVYAKFGYECIKVPVKPVLDRVQMILDLI